MKKKFFVFVLFCFVVIMIEYKKEVVSFTLNTNTNAKRETPLTPFVYALRRNASQRGANDKAFSGHARHR